MDALPITKATFLPDYRSYEELAGSKLPDNTIVYSSAEGLQFQRPALEDATDHKKSRDDFQAAVENKFGEVTNYAISLEKKEEAFSDNGPLTLGKVREVIKERNRAAQIEELKKNPLFANNPCLVKFTAALILANEEAVQAEAELDRLGYPREHLEQALKDAGKMLLDAGITGALVGTAAHVVLIAAAGILHAGISSSTLGGPVMANLVPPSKPNSTPSWPTVPQAATRTIITGVITIAVELIAKANIFAGLAASFVASSADTRSHICHWIDSQIEDWGGNFKLNKLSDEVSELFEKCHIHLPSSYAKFKETSLALLGSEEEMNHALTDAMTKRALANALLEKISEIHEVPRQIARAAQKATAEMRGFAIAIEGRLSVSTEKAYKSLSLQLKKINLLTQQIATANPLLPAELKELIFLSKEACNTILEIDDKWRKSTPIKELEHHLKEIIGLAEKGVSSEFFFNTEERSPEEVKVIEAAAEVVGVFSEKWSDVEKLSERVEGSKKGIEEFCAKNQEELRKKPQLAASMAAIQERTSKIELLVQEVKGTLKSPALFPEEKIHELSQLAQQNLADIESFTLRRNSMIQQAGEETKKILELIQKLAILPKELEEGELGEAQPVLEKAMEWQLNDFFRSVKAGLSRGSATAQRWETQFSLEEQKALQRKEFAQNPYSYSGTGGPRWKM